MRITNAMMVNQFLSDANSSLSRVSKYQDQVDSTRRVNNISDDPQATLAALKARNKLSDLDAYQANINTTKSYLKEAESAATDLNEIIQTAYEKIISAKGKGQDEMNLIATEIGNLKDEIVSIGNTKVGSTYIFGGYNFTGTTDGKDITAPFSIDPNTKHLMYNGIDLSKDAWAKDYQTNTDIMLSFSSGIKKDTADLNITNSDVYARDTLCADALEKLNNMVSKGKDALSAAKTYGIDESLPEYKKLSDMVSGLSDLAGDLYNECSKGFDQELDADLRFNKGKAQGILDSVNTLIENSDGPAGFDKSLSEAVDQLKTVIADDMSTTKMEEAITEEKGKSAVLKIGPSQTAQISFSGMDLVGQGSDNVYHMFSKSISMLESGDTEGLSVMISKMQEAQKNVLSFETTIGTTENRMDLISGRYDSSIKNYKTMQSEAIDADMAEAYTDFKTAQTVYNAALNAGAKIVQTSLLDFLR